MLNNIALLLNFYNCRNELERLIDSIPPGLFDTIIAVDGIYKFQKEQNPCHPDMSNDGSRDLLLSHDKIKKENLYLIGYPNTYEFNKRNKYLELCEKLGVDVGIICDSDEFFIIEEGVKPETAVARFRNNIELVTNKSKNVGHNVFAMHTLDVANNYNIHRPRVWKNPGELRYLQGSHYYYANLEKDKEAIETFRKNRQMYCQPYAEVIKGLVLAHSHNLRSKYQNKIHDQYVDYLRRFEGLIQSYYFDMDQSHKLASMGISRNEINISNKDEYIKKVT